MTGSQQRTEERHDCQGRLSGRERLPPRILFCQPPMASFIIFHFICTALQSLVMSCFCIQHPPTVLTDAFYHLVDPVEGRRHQLKQCSQKATKTQTLHPQYFIMMANLKQTVIMSQNHPKPSTINKKGPITLYIGMKLIFLMLS